jgi:hypothetical protein
MMGALGIVLIGSVLALGGGLLLRRQSGRQRSETMRTVAHRLGWAFREEVPFSTIPDLDRFELFRPGRNKRLNNLMTSPPDGPRAVVFDYAYTTGGGNSQRRHRQTVFYTTSDALSLPSFSLRPEHFFHRVAGVFGYQDIDLRDRPAFSQLFLLRGDQEERVRTAFAGRVADFFERRPGTCAAGVGRELLFWRPRRRAKPEEVQTLIDDGLDLAARFTAPHDM